MQKLKTINGDSQFNEKQWRAKCEKRGAEVSIRSGLFHYHHPILFFTDNEFEPLVFIEAFGNCLIKMRIELAIRNQHYWLEESRYYWGAKTLLEKLAYSNGCGELKWDADYFLSVYPEFAHIYFEGLYKSQKAGEIEQRERVAASN